MRITLLILLISICTLSAEEDYVNNFFYSKIGDSLSTISNDKHQLRLYIFLDQNSCMVCQEIIPQLYDILSKEIVLESIIFFSGNDNEYVRGYAEERNWKYKLIADYNNLYSKYYGIRQLPSYILLDDKGIVLYRDKLGGINTTKNILDSLINEVKDLKTSDDDVEFIKSVKVFKDNGKPIYASHLRNNYYIKFKEDEHFLINNDMTKIIYKVNLNGEVIGKIEIDELLKYHDTYGDNLVDYVYKPQSGDLVCFVNIAGVIPRILHYNFLNNESYLFELPEIENNIRTGMHIEYDPNSENYFFDLRLNKNKESKIMKEYNQLIIFNRTGETSKVKKIIKSTNKMFDSQKYIIFNYAYPSFINGSLYFTNMLSSEVLELSSKGELQNHYEINNSKYYRYNPAPMDETDRAGHMFFRSRASINNSLLIDKKTNKIYVHFQNMHKINDEDIVLGLRNPSDYYLVQVYPSKEDKCVEYRLPTGHLPFHIEDGIIYTSTNKNGLEIHKLRLKY